MMKPVIFVIDDDAQVLQTIERDLRNKYRKDYRILGAESGEIALESVKELRLKNDVVALFISDQRMPQMQGIDFLEATKEFYPEAKKVLLTAYSDSSAAIKAINSVQLDYYLMKPWDPPEENLYPVIDELLDEWQSLFKPKFRGIKLIGYQWTKHSHTIKDFLAGNLIPYSWLDIQMEEEAKQLIKLGDIDCKDLPALVFEDGTVLRNPSLAELADKVGLKSIASQKLYDVTIIGAGPAGLASAVYGASEGLRTLLIDRRAPGGQAGTSSRIENYLGFPSGVSGSELTRRAITQAERLGAEFLTPVEVADITFKDTYKSIILSDGREIKTLSIIIATGVDYARLNTKGVEELTGAGIYYGAATTEANACRNEDVYIVGGGNSAGQAAMHLAKFARKVHILIRRDSLKYTMSQYLIEQIEATSNIELLTKAQVAEAIGDKQLEKIVLSIDGRENVTVPAKSLFIFIGTKPCTEWIKEVIKNEKGYIETGRDLEKYPEFKKTWKEERDPLILESSHPGVFVAGDVRAGAMNRVASAVGEGSIGIKLVHEYLAQI